eukprot:3670992-Prymnesium_polylepis.1
MYCRANCCAGAIERTCGLMELAMKGSATQVMVYVPRGPMFIIESNRRSSRFSVDCSKCDDALLTRTSICPKWRTTSSTAAWTESILVTSHWTPSALPPAASMSSHACSIDPGPYEMPPLERPRAQIVAPPRAQRMAMP